MSEKKERKEYFKRYNKEKTDFIGIKVQKPVGAAIRQAAKDSGQSLQGYIVDAAHERMKKEGKPLLIDLDTENSQDHGGKVAVNDSEGAGLCHEKRKIRE